MNHKRVVSLLFYSADQGFGESNGLYFFYTLDNIIDIDREMISMFFHHV